MVIYFLVKKSFTAVGLKIQDGFSEKIEKTSTDGLILQKVLRCSKLAVLSSIYTDVIMIKKSKVWGISKSYSIYKYVGQIEGGIKNLEDCQFTIDGTNRTIYVTMPESKIIHHTILKIEKFDEKNSIFSRITNSEVFKEIDARKKDAEDKLIEYGFLREAKQRAEDVISQMIMAMGYNDYDIVFNEKKPKGTTLIPTYEGENLPLEIYQAKNHV